MDIAQRTFDSRSGWTVPEQDLPGARLVLTFGAREAFEQDGPLDALRTAYPAAELIGCSTAGEICGTTVGDGRIVATAIDFEHTRLATVSCELARSQDSRSAGDLLARALDQADLSHVFVLAEGVHVNGTELVEGLRRGLPEGVPITGGLAGDGTHFRDTCVLASGRPVRRAVSLLGFYGGALRVGYGSLGGWDPFGPVRTVTRAVGNVLYELDGQPALRLYRTYLGPYAEGLPASGLRFPLSIRGRDGAPPIVRTILGIDEAMGSLTFAGDVPQQAQVQLMKANLDRLIDGAVGAAEACRSAWAGSEPRVAILISCVGRKLVLGQRVEEEVESVRDCFGPDTALCGFYSYGEIAPFVANARCELHNQTMTITTLVER